jgi:hypothetical protein
MSVIVSTGLKFGGDCHVPQVNGNENQYGKLHQLVGGHVRLSSFSVSKSPAGRQHSQSSRSGLPRSVGDKFSFSLRLPLDRQHFVQISSADPDFCVGDRLEVGKFSLVNPTVHGAGMHSAVIRRLADREQCFVCHKLFAKKTATSIICGVLASDQQNIGK